MKAQEKQTEQLELADMLERAKEHPRWHRMRMDERKKKQRELLQYQKDRKDWR